MDTNSEKDAERYRSLATIFGLLVVGLALIWGSYQVTSPAAGSVMRDIGFVLAPVAIVAFLYERFAEKRKSEILAEHLVRNVVREFRRTVLGTEGRSEVLAVYPKRDEINLQDFFESASHAIDALTTNLDSLTIYADTIMQRAKKKGMKVRLLTLKPTSPFVSIRYPELGLEQHKDFAMEMIIALRQFCCQKQTLSSADQQRVEIKTFQNPPSLMFFRADDRLIVGFILRQGRGRNLIHVEFCVSQDETKKACARDFVDHFDKVWKEATSVSLEDVRRLEEEVSKTLAAPKGASA